MSSQIVTLLQVGCSETLMSMCAAVLFYKIYFNIWCDWGALIIGQMAKASTLIPREGLMCNFAILHEHFIL